MVATVFVGVSDEETEVRTPLLSASQAAFFSFLSSLVKNACGELGGGAQTVRDARRLSFSVFTFRPMTVFVDIVWELLGGGSLPVITGCLGPDKLERVQVFWFFFLWVGGVSGQAAILLLVFLQHHDFHILEPSAASFNEIITSECLQQGGSSVWRLPPSRHKLSSRAFSSGRLFFIWYNHQRLLKWSSSNMLIR